MPQLSAICFIGADRACSTMSTPIFSSPLAAERAFSTTSRQRTRATPPPGRMPSSTAARVACKASSTRAFFCFMSDFGAGADRDDGHAAGQLGQPLLKLLAVVFAVGGVDLIADLLDAVLDVGRLAGPLTIVVESLSTVICLARPRCSSVRFSSLMPRSSLISVPAVSMAMSPSMALRRSPKPGALTAQTLSTPRSLLTTSAVRASPSTSSAMINSGLPVWATRSRIGIRSRRLAIFFSWIRI